MALPTLAITNHKRYDVFLSFSGEDTRYSFTDHLYKALVESGIRTFRDNGNENVNNEIEDAIKASRASIVVLSKNWADSNRSLDELVMIMERRRRFFHVVIPVYYHVDVSDVIRELKDCIIQPRGNVHGWEQALTEVANLSAKVLSGPETEFITDIINTICHKLRLNLVSSPPHLTGMDIRAEDINYWVKNKQDVEILVICGMVGIGKTTLAKYIYETHLPKFQSGSFVEDIGIICERPYGLCELQEQLLADILDDKVKELDVTWYKSHIEKVLENKKVLIVLDDIDKKEQIEALLGMGKIDSGSKIIITSRLQTIKSLFGSTYHKFKEHKLELLNEHESLELLSWYAFGSKIPMEGFKDLASKAAQYSAGNPLALKMLGSLFVSAEESHNGNNIENWMSTLNLLEIDLHYRIQGILRISFKCLPYISYQELFLHIACFFIGEDKDYVVKILEPDYSATAGIVTLVNRCLLTVSKSKKLMLHRIFIEMARSMVVEESPTDLGKRRRVWRNMDSYTLLRQGKGSETIEGLSLDMRMLKEEKHNMPAAFDVDSLAKMDNLKLLQLNYVECYGSYEYFPENLRWLCWHGFHLGAIPSELYMGNLVAIDMSYSKLERFEPPMALINLKTLKLEYSYSLAEIDNLSFVPNLENFSLAGCSKLIRISDTIAELKSLSQLNVMGCTSLLKASGFDQQPVLTFPYSLEKILVNNCDLERSNHVLSFQSHSCLQDLHLGNNHFESLPDYNHLKNLRVLNLSFCSRLKHIEHLPRTLDKLFITSCKSLAKVNFESRRFTLREIDYEGCTNLLEIEGLYKLVPLSKIDEANLGHMKWLKPYQNHEMCLIGDYQLTVGRSWHIQMLYEFGITSTFLPDIMDLDIRCEYKSKFSSLSFDVPPHFNNHVLKGLNVTFKYTNSDDEKQVWPAFAKISNVTKCRDWIYNPMVFGKPGNGEVAIWLSYWSMENLLDVGDKVNVSIIMENRSEVIECGASIVYGEDIIQESWQNNTEWDEILARDLSSFQLTMDTYYLCRFDFLKSMDVDEPTPSWYRDLVPNKFDYTAMQGWRKTGRSQKFQR